MVYAGIVAGGTGSRMGADIPKQFIVLAGKTILAHTVLRFLEVDKIDKIYIAVHPEWLGHTKKLFSDHTDKIVVIPGGSDRNKSVFNIIDAVKEDNELSDDDILLTHDAVRPFVSADTILANIEAALKYTVCTTAVPATDTILYSENEIVSETLDRSKLYHAQTPQSFKIKAILETYQKLDESQRSKLTDVCGIFTAAGKKVHIVSGEVSNIKITTPFDLKIAEAVLGKQSGSEKV